jgi:flagellar biogenesis protein FliO
LINKVKSGEWKIPKFLDNFVRIKSAFSNADKRYKINIVQREILPDGSEILVLGVGDRRLLLSRTMNQGIRYLTDLEAENSVAEKTLTDLENIEAFK